MDERGRGGFKFFIFFVCDRKAPPNGGGDAGSGGGGDVGSGGGGDVSGGFKEE